MMGQQGVVQEQETELTPMEDLRAKVGALDRFVGNSFLADVCQNADPPADLQMIIDALARSCTPDDLQYANAFAEQLFRFHFPLFSNPVLRSACDGFGDLDLTGDTSVGQSYYAVCEILLAIRDAALEEQREAYNAELMPGGVRTLFSAEKENQ
jgi:hypothetical protein